MTIKHHPDLSMLMSCAAGSQPEAMAAVMASHLAVCTACQREVARMERIGAALFDKIEPAPVMGDAPLVAMRAGEACPDAGPQRGFAVNAAGSEVPPPLVPLLGTSLDDIPWRRIAPGIWHHPIELSKGAKGDLRLLKVAPGKAMPEHGHDGEELTLLLRGSYRDETGEYRAGDVADLDEEIEHQPVADPETGCICLVATNGKVRFKGLFARMVQPFTGL